MDSISWRDTRQKGLLWMYLSYGSIGFTLVIMIAQNYSTENIFSTVWTISFCAYLLIKSAYTMLGEIRGKLIWLLETANLCEYILFVAGNVIIRNMNYSEAGTIEKINWGLICILDIHACLTLLLIFIAAIYEYCGYNIRLKKLFFDIFHFEIPVLHYVVLAVILKSSSYQTITQSLIPTYESMADNNNNAKVVS